MWVLKSFGFFSNTFLENICKQKGRVIRDNRKQKTRYRNVQQWTHLNFITPLSERILKQAHLSVHNKCKSRKIKSTT